MVDARSAGTDPRPRLLIMAWSTLRSDFDDLEMQIQVLAQRGLTFGLHVVTSASRWADYRAAIRDLFGNPARGDWSTSPTASCTGTRTAGCSSSGGSRRHTVTLR